MKEWLAERPWIWVVVFFACFVSAWITLVLIAIQNAPETVPLAQ